MATVSKGRTFVSGETVTPTKLNELVDLATVTAIQTADISDAQITTAKIADANVTTAKLATVTAQALLPAGAVMPFAMNSAPSGWLAADGTEYSKTGTYAALFAAIGTTHGETNGSGGAGTSHFRVPDLRGIFVRGSGSQTISGITYSGTFAAKQQDALKSHTHPGSFLLSSGPISLGGTGASILAPLTIGSVSATGDAETRPANIALLYCIKF